MRRGQLDISFGMLFSIIVIIATIALAFYFLRVFFQTSSCTGFELLHQEIRERVDAVWRAPQARELLTLRLPARITAVCFGTPDIQEERGSVLDSYRVQGAGVYFYPPQEACAGNLAAKTLTRGVPAPAWFCVTPNARQRATITLLKEGPTATVVRITS
jgi:hypothetical protein